MNFAGPPPRCSSTRPARGSSCIGCTGSRPTPSRSRYRFAGVCGEPRTALPAHTALSGADAVSVRGAERPPHRCTTRHAQAIYPFVAAGGLGGHGVFIGRDSSGAAFCYDPWALYGQGLLDDPNVIVLGKLGQGKSALVKTLLWRVLL